MNIEGFQIVWADKPLPRLFINGDFKSGIAFEAVKHAIIGMAAALPGTVLDLRSLLYMDSEGMHLVRYLETVGVSIHWNKESYAYAGYQRKYKTPETKEEV